MSVLHPAFRKNGISLDSRPSSFLRLNPLAEHFYKEIWPWLFFPPSLSPREFPGHR